MFYYQKRISSPDIVQHEWENREERKEELKKVRVIQEEIGCWDERTAVDLSGLSQSSIQYAQAADTLWDIWHNDIKTSGMIGNETWVSILNFQGQHLP